MTKQFISAALAAALAAGMATMSYAQTGSMDQKSGNTAGAQTDKGGQGAGSVSGAKSNTTGENPSDNANPNGMSSPQR